MQSRGLSRWPLIVVAGSALVLVVVRMRWPQLNFDNTSLILIGIAALSLLVAYLPIRRLKWGEFEAELDVFVDRLERKVSATEASSSLREPRLPSKQSTAQESNRVVPSWQLFFDEYIRIVNSPSTNVEKILAAAILVERMVTVAGTTLASPDEKASRNPIAVVTRLAEEHLITPEERVAFAEFWELRAKIVHGGLAPNDEQTARILDLAWRLVRTFA